MLPFEASRRLIGANLFFAGCGAQLETVHVVPDVALLAGWRTRAARAREYLGWDDDDERGVRAIPRVVARAHAGGASLALAAPVDALFTATEVNEWALCAALAAQDPARWSGLEAALVENAREQAPEAHDFIPPVLDETAALARFAQLAAHEARPALRSLLAAAATRQLPYVLDEDTLTLGAGAGGRSFDLAALPDASAVPWQQLHDIPTALVTGSNGKTTTVRLLAACARAHGWSAAYCCTDGVFLDDRLLASGDYSGPLGARQVLRERAACAAVIETARGGILRRGIAVSHAQVALVSNVSADHFGEYGIEDLDGLTDVKLSVAGVLDERGLLVLNADDPRLVAKAPTLARRFGRSPRLAWFALDAGQPLLRAHRAEGGATCGVDDGRLVLSLAGADHDLGAVADMPLSVAGSATYNIANLTGAALAAAALGVRAPAIAAVFARFGTSIADNPGRMMRFERDGVRILVDYAHNPEGLRGLLRVAQHLRGGGRLGLLLGHAGNRQDAEIEALAQAAAEFAPQLIVIKENEAHLRGRPAGEIPRVIHAALRRAGLPEEALPVCLSELEAVHCALAWARPGDVLALPVHAAAARAAVIALLGGRAAADGGPWKG
ncbi:MAG TPA: cyanophycin synthetase [Steroidobacteraceae bacterium]|nr:cyanophycin synthetase [Steroidobacteraceae bacterium]